MERAFRLRLCGFQLCRECGVGCNALCWGWSAVVVEQVVEAVDTYLPIFHDAFDDETAWGPAKQVAAALTERGVDLTDRHAVDNAIHQLNAEQLAHRLLP